MNVDKSDFFDNVLIRLKREYGKEELYLSLKALISKKDVQIGELLSDIDHLKYTILKHEERFNVNINNRFKESSIYIKMSNQIKAQSNELEKFKKSYGLGIRTMNNKNIKLKKELYKMKQRLRELGGDIL